MDKKIKVFVYGTLMRDRWNHYYLSSQNYLGLARLSGFDMYNVRSFPGIVKSGCSSFVLGEVYEITPRTLERLDRLEGEGYMYKREQVNVEIENEIHAVYVYVWLGSTKSCEQVLAEDMPWKPVKVRCAR